MTVCRRHQEWEHRVPDDRIIGYVDWRGRLLCVPCWEAAGSPHYDARGTAPVYAWASPHNGEPCDTCGERLIYLAAVDRARELGCQIGREVRP